MNIDNWPDNGYAQALAAQHKRKLPKHHWARKALMTPVNKLYFILERLFDRLVLNPIEAFYDWLDRTLPHS